MRPDFNAKVEFSTRELTAKEKIAMKDYNNATRIDSCVTDDSCFMIDVADFVIINVHNEHSKTPDYRTLVIINEAGIKFSTSSESLTNSLMDIYEELSDEGEGLPFTIEVYRKPSKNYQGKSFLSCSLA